MKVLIRHGFKILQNRIVFTDIASTQKVQRTKLFILLSNGIHHVWLEIEENKSEPREKRINLRIGMHMGDVIESKGDIYGDAVNIASRIEPLAEAGGICLSRHVYEHVKNKVQFNFKSLGFKSLKNVKEQVEIFKIMMPWEEAKDIYASSDLTRIAVLPFTNIS